MFKKLDSKEINISIDERGMVFYLPHEQIRNLHIVTMKPGAIRGNHFHDSFEFLSVIQGQGICEIELKDPKQKKRIIKVMDAVAIYQVNPGIYHTIKNIGQTIFYVLCYNSEKK